MGRIRILHISDVHVTRLDEILRYEMMASGPLQRFMARVERGYRDALKAVYLNSSDPSILTRLTAWMLRSVAEFDLVTISGDLADSGSADDLALARRFIFGPASRDYPHETAARPGQPSIGTIAGLPRRIPVVLFPGNHDHFASELLRVQSPSEKTSWYRQVAKRFEEWVSQNGERALEYQFAVDEKGNLVPRGKAGPNSERFAMIVADFAIDRTAGRAPDSVFGHVSQGRVVRSDLDQIVERTKETGETMPVIWAMHFAPEPGELGPPEEPVREVLKLIDSDQLEAAACDLNVPVILAGHTHRYLDLTKSSDRPNLARVASAACRLPHLDGVAQTGVQIISFDIAGNAITDIDVKPIEYCVGCGFGPVAGTCQTCSRAA